MLLKKLKVVALLSHSFHLVAPSAKAFEQLVPCVNAAHNGLSVGTFPPVHNILPQTMPPPPPAQVRGYRSLLAEKRSELGDKCNKLKGGLEKLAETTEQVGDAGRGEMEGKGCVCLHPW